MKKLLLVFLFIPLVSFGQGRGLEETKKQLRLLAERIKSDPTFDDKVGLISNESKTSNHIFFGLDLNKDWYSLTDYSQLNYVFFKKDNPNQSIMYVKPNDLSYGNLKQDDNWRIKEFKKLGFKLMLGFPTDYINRDLKHIPTKLIATYNYVNINNRYKFDKYVNKDRSYEQEEGVEKLIDLISLLNHYYGNLSKYGETLNKLNEIEQRKVYGRLILSTYTGGLINSGFLVWEGNNYHIIISFNIDNNKQIELTYSKPKDD